MLKKTLKPHQQVVGSKKAKRLAAFAFFLGFAGGYSAEAQTNLVDGTAFGTNYSTLATAPSIASVGTGLGSAEIGFADTTNLTISHAVSGYVIVSNQFDGFTINATGGSLTSTSGAAIEIQGGTNLTITSGTFSGTDALRLIDSSAVTISNGTYTGGSGGNALYATNSSVSIDGNATFSGGSNAAALLSRNSDLTINGGTFQGGAFGTGGYFGLVSIVSAGMSNTVALNGGNFNSIDFTGGGTQSVTFDSGVSVQDFVVVDGGTVLVDNLSNDPLQDVLIRNGSMRLANDFTLASDGSFVLDSTSSHADFASLGVSSNAMLWVGPGTVEVASDFSLDGGGTLSFAILTNAYGSLVVDTALFQTNATIQIDATAAGFSQGTNDVTLVASPNSDGISVLYANGTTNTATSSNIASNLNLDVFASGRTVLSDILSEGGSNMVFRFTTQSLQQYWGVTGQMAALANEIEGNAQMLQLIDQYADPAQGARAVERTYFTTFNNFQIALQGMRSAVGQSLSRGSEFREQLTLIPTGARGPERRNDTRGWVKYYGHYFTHDEDGLDPDYNSIQHGGAVGVDTSLGNLLVGVSGGSSHYRINQDDDGRSDTVAYHGSLYGTYGMDRGYIDAGVAYGWNQVDTRTADPFVLEGSFDADMISGYLGGGYDLIDTRGGTVFTPEASIQYATYQQDAYTEEGVTATPRVIEEFDADSLLSTLGMNIAMLQSEKLKHVGFQLDGRLHWMHEFNADPDNMNFMLQGGSNQYQLAYPALDEDIYRIGIGAAFFNMGPNKPKNVMLRLDFDELFGDGFNSHNFSAKLVYAF